MTEIKHSMTIQMPDWCWRVTQPTVRTIRQRLQAERGTSRVVLKDGRLSVTLGGPAGPVLDAADEVSKLGERVRLISNDRESVRDRYRRFRDTHGPGALKKLRAGLMERARDGGLGDMAQEIDDLVGGL